MIIERHSKCTRVAEIYKQYLLEQRLPCGSHVASTRELAEMYHISFLTANKVLKLLVEQDFLERRSGSGTFVKHDPPARLKIGYTGSEPEPFEQNEFRLIHTTILKKTFRDAEIGLHYISYDTLCNPVRSREMFDDLDGLLLDAMYVDSKTLPQLRQFQKPVVLIGKNSIEKRLLASQVLADWEFAVNQLKGVLSSYKKIMILSCGHDNAKDQEALIRKICTEHEINTVYLAGNNPHLESFKYFLKHQTGYENTLIFSLSGRCSEGLRDAFGTNPLPAVIECDNYEKYLSDPEHNAVFTAIDGMLEEIYKRALSLLCNLIESKENSRQILMIKPDIVYRRSFPAKQKKE